MICSEKRVVDKLGRNRKNRTCNGMVSFSLSLFTSLVSGQREMPVHCLSV